MTMSDQYERHPDDEFIDEVSIRLVPRFKTSDLSGDEWRVSAAVEIKRKGTVMFSRSYRSVGDAAAHLPWLLKTWTEMPHSEIPEWTKQIKRDKALCHQPGCGEPATAVYRIKQRFSREGYPQPRQLPWKSLRAFCKRHGERGDSSLEDCDENYEIVSGSPIVEPNPSDVSPAAVVILPMGEQK